MANSVQTKMQGLIDLISRPSRPQNAPAQQGDAFRKSMMDPESPAGQATPSAPAPAGQQARSGETASNELNWVEGDGTAPEEAIQDEALQEEAEPEGGIDTGPKSPALEKAEAAKNKVVDKGKEVRKTMLAGKAPVVTFTDRRGEQQEVHIPRYANMLARKRQ